MQLHSSPEEIVQHVQYKQTPAGRASSQFAQSPLLLALLSLPILLLLLPAIVPASFGGPIPEPFSVTEAALLQLFAPHLKQCKPRTEVRYFDNAVTERSAVFLPRAQVNQLTPT